MHIPLERIDQSQLQALVSGKAEEALTIEYKPETYGGSDTARAEFLADVSSFANTRGGDLIIGIDAPKGVPKGLTPIFFGNADGGTPQARSDGPVRLGAAHTEFTDPIGTRRRRERLGSNRRRVTQLRGATPRDL